MRITELSSFAESNDFDDNFKTAMRAKFTNRFAGRTPEDVKTPGGMGKDLLPIDSQRTNGERLYMLGEHHSNNLVVFGIHGDEVVLVGALKTDPSHGKRGNLQSNHISRQIREMAASFGLYKLENPLEKTTSNGMQTKVQNHELSRAGHGGEEVEVKKDGRWVKVVHYPPGHAVDGIDISARR